jgi:hypothetical protein
MHQNLQIKDSSMDHLSYELFFFMQAVSMFLIACAIGFPVDEELSHNLSILGTLM